jgi:hypothetical protein
MALKTILAKIDEVDEKYRDLYTEQGGKWVLTGIDGVKTQGDIDRLQQALTKERNDHTAAKAELKTLKESALAWDDLKPEDVKAKLEKLETFESGNQVPELAKNFETTVNARVQTLLEQKLKSETTKLNRTIDELKGKLGESTQLVQTYESQNVQRTVQDAVRAAAVQLKVLPDAVPDLLIVAGQHLKMVDGKVQTDDGRDPAQWLEDSKQSRAYMWPAARGTGAHGSVDASGNVVLGKDNPFSREGWNMTKGAQLLRADPTQAAKLAEAAGVPKGPDGTFQYHVMPAPPQK